MWYSPSNMRTVIKLSTGALMLIAFMLIVAGCATTNDSDMPWNAPQPWEGVPGIPGMTHR